jgi:beta-galactosidase
LSLIGFVPSMILAQRSAYYVDPLLGNDRNAGTSPTAAWKTLEQANAHVFLPGETLLLRAGRQFAGQLVLHDVVRVAVGPYGSGDKPRIEGDGNVNAAVIIRNSSRVTLSDLDVSNHGAVRAARRAGVLVELRGFGVAHDIRLLRLDVHDVNGSLVKKEGGGTGIHTSNDGSSRFDSLLIEHCTVRRCERNGVVLDGTSNRTAWFPNIHVVIRGNLIEKVPGDGIVPIGCDGALIEHNIMREATRLLPDGESAAGIWPWSCDNTIIQYNEVSGHKAPWDGQGFDADWNCRNTIIQYNYSHDNEGGFLLVCNDGSASSGWSAGNRGTIIRYNVSVNDGLRATGKHAGFSPVIHITGPASCTYVYNNVIYVPRRPAGLDSSLVTFGNWHGYADSTFFRDNIFDVSSGTGSFTPGRATNIFFEHNLYHGAFLNRPADASALTGDPGFRAPAGPGVSGLAAMQGFRLRRPSDVGAFPRDVTAVRAEGPAISGRHRFTLGDSTFLLDGKPFQMISGEMHYTRVPREAWRARMRAAKAMGLNTIGTYVFWNVHEPEKGRFDFSGNNDIAAYVRMAKEEGLWVVLRPSPYVCAEWEFGGYPYWLQQEKGLVVRSTNPRYLAEYRKYITAVGRQLAPLQVNHGGNILMVQVENEYGSYGSDKAYLDTNRRLFREAGFDGLLYTCDPAPDLENGHVSGLLPAVNGLDDTARVKAVIRAHHDGKGPFYIAEWYPAWFDWWGAPHHTVPAADHAPALDAVLSAGISINMYMFHGGTTRGFMNGANYKGSTPYQPQTSSYDYDAPLDEAGNPTEKFMAFRSVIQKHVDHPLPPVPTAKPAVALPPIHLTVRQSLFTHLPVPVVHRTPLTFEALGQAYGFVLYRTLLKAASTGLLTVGGLRDYGQVFVNGRRVGVLDRRLDQDSVLIAAHASDTLDILVENLGRINFGPYLLQNEKGITGSVTLDGTELQGWRMYKLPFANAPDVIPGGVAQQAPMLSAGSFRLEKPEDTYLDMSAWGKGCAWVNGHNLGRYWYIGPQQTLYVPAEWLRRGDNKVVVFDEAGVAYPDLTTLDHAILNHQTDDRFTPGKTWTDDKGDVINAHGGGVLFDKGVYYWFGEKRDGHQSQGVNVYTSTDLYHWTFKGLALSTSEDTASDIARGCIMERPKVLYNSRTHQYVMWFHLELRGNGYAAARAAVAVSEKATGPYTYVHSFRPNGNMSRDMTIFADDDGAAYEVYSSRDNYDMRIARLSDDYLTVTPADSLIARDHQEAPALFKRAGNYYLVTSACTGWAPNKASLYTATSIFGPWTRGENPMRGTDADRTFEGQSTFILPVNGTFIFIADRWNPKDLKDSRYLWLPVDWEAGKPAIPWTDEWRLGTSNR